MVSEAFHSFGYMYYGCFRHEDSHIFVRSRGYFWTEGAVACVITHVDK